MAEVTREVVHDRMGVHGVAAWLALALSIIALILGWMAYDRTGQNVDDRIREQVNRAVDNIQSQNPNQNNNNNR